MIICVSSASGTTFIVINWFKKKKKTWSPSTPIRIPALVIPYCYPCTCIRNKRIETHLKRTFSLIKLLIGKIALLIHEYVRPKQKMTGHYHPKIFIQLTPASNTCQFRFYAGTIPEGNSLLAEVIVEPSLKSFNTHLNSSSPYYLYLNF